MPETARTYCNLILGTCSCGHVCCCEVTTSTAATTMTRTTAATTCNDQVVERLLLCWLCVAVVGCEI